MNEPVVIVNSGASVMPKVTVKATCFGANCENYNVDTCCLIAYEEADFTKWMSLDESPPVKVGVYQVTTGMGGVRFRSWDGNSWLNKQGKVVSPIFLVNGIWRGLNREWE